MLFKKGNTLSPHTQGGKEEKDVRGDVGEAEFKKKRAYVRRGTTGRNSFGRPGMPRLVPDERDFPCRTCGAELDNEPARALGVCLWCIAATDKTVRVPSPVYAVVKGEDEFV